MLAYPNEIERKATAEYDYVQVEKSAIKQWRKFGVTSKTQLSDYKNEDFVYKYAVLRGFREGHAYKITNSFAKNDRLKTAVIDGQLLSDLPYMVMHRCAVKKERYGQGFGKAMFAAFEGEARRQGFRSLRIDTHENNAAMRHLLELSGFRFCGRVILKPNKDRMVFEKVLD